MIPRTITRGWALLSLALPLLWATPRDLAAAPGDAIDPAAATFAVKAKRIYPMGGGDGKPIEGGTLLVVDGKIAAIGDDVEIPGGIPVHDHPQAVIIPGLVDAGSRLAGSHRGQDSVGAQFRAIDGFDPYANHAELLAEGITTAWVGPASNRLLAGQGAIVKLAGEPVVSERSDLVVILGEAAFGAPPKQKIPFPSSEDVPIEPAEAQRPRSRLGQFPELEAKLHEAAEYAAARRAAADERPEYDAALDALADALEAKLPFRVDAKRARDILQALRHRNLFAGGLTISGATEAHRVSEHLAKAGIPVILEVPVRFDAPGSDLGIGPDPADESIETASVLAGAGVRFAITSYALARPGDLMMSAITAVRGGLAPTTALAAVTSSAAEILGIGDRVGSLQPGKDADFVILTGEPMQTSTTVLETWVDGHRAYAASTGGASLIVRAGTIFTGAGETIRDGAVLVENGKITAVGPTVPTPRGARVIDAGPDAFVTPGFIDAHSHLGLENDQADADPDLSLSWAVAHEKPNFAHVAKAGVTTVLVAPYRPNRSGSQVLAMKTSGASREELVVDDPAAVFFSLRGADPLMDIQTIEGILKKGKAYDDQWKKYHEDLAKWKEEQAKKKADEDAKKKKDKEEEEARKKQEQEKKNAADEEKTPEEETPPAEEKKADPISGTWRTVISGGPIPEPQEGTMKLRLDGINVTGQLISMIGGEVDVTGTFQQNQLVLEMDVDSPVGAPKIEATLDREDHLTGKLLVGDMFSLDFEADRTEKEVPEIRLARRKKGDDGRPQPPVVQEALEPYRKLLTGEIAAVIDVQTGAQIDRVLDLFTAQFQVPLVLLNADEAATLGSRIVEAKAGVVLPKQIVRRSAGRGIEIPGDRLSRLGIPVAFQSDAEDAARHLPHNVAYAVYNGMDATSALRALTIDAARMYRIDDRVGTLEVGKDGDLLVFSGAPFEAVSRLEHVIISGKEVHQP
jgi:imidazolonepropionase-like amidohydrolase